MRLLFLDDDYTRHARFKHNHRGDDIVAVWDYPQLVAALDEQTAPFDVAYLDHDLDLTRQLDGREYTGTDAAAYIAAMPAERRPRKIVIHSWNDPGRQRMRATLIDAGYDPGNIKLMAFSPLM